ncbi:uncharacterized protein LOC108596613 [Drosophila busckii]|uniref:uncharacterized protein LOC108596613 n=1 Tax=Drosophila busckii TaxID=30019 RepID=UPI00083F138B|nr:uncharacterized protein LOC108596613 [Drosophila busckii]
MAFLKEFLMLLLLLAAANTQSFQTANNDTDFNWNFNSSEAHDTAGLGNTTSIDSTNSFALPNDQLMKLLLLALFLHMTAVGIGTAIYCIIYYKARKAKDKLIKAHQLVQYARARQHVPNTLNCVCDGCGIARQIILQQIVP